MKGLTQTRACEVLDYDPLSGIFTWKHRPDRTKAWNTRHAGKPAGGKNRNGYIQICIDGQYLKAHRLAILWVTGLPPTSEVDHRNHVRNDNRWTNLRPATHGQNRTNGGSRNHTGFRGVMRDLRNNRPRFTALIEHDKTPHYLGIFDTAEEAARAYDAKAIELHGAFATLNFPQAQTA